MAKKKNKLSALALPPWLKIIKGDAGGDDGDEPIEVMVYGAIGSDYYGDSGIEAKAFNTFLNEIPNNRKITMRINSPGGNVWDGVAIGDRIANRGGVTCRVEGQAASIASYIAMSAEKTILSRGSSIMIHRTSGMAVGNSDDMASMKGELDAHDEMLAGFYADKTGKSKTVCKNLMVAQTRLFGQEAVDEGFADEFLDVDGSNTVNNIDNTLDYSRMLPAFLKSAPIQGAATKTKTEEDTMNRTKIIAMLKKHGSPVADDATDEALHAQLETVLNAAAEKVKTATESATASDLATVKAELKVIKDQELAARKEVIASAVMAAIADDKIPAGQKDRWIERALADKTVLNDLAQLPSRPPGTSPVSNVIEITAASFEDIQSGFEKQRSAILAYMGKKCDYSPELARDVAQGSKGVARIMNQLRKRFPSDSDGLVCAPILNANTISADLKRQVIMSQALRDFKRVIYPLSLFSTKFERVPLQGLDTVIVPYYPLITTASIDFNAANGYDTPLATTTNSKTLTINKRKYQMLNFTASEISRQPWLDIMKLSTLAAEQLAIDVFQDFNSLFTAANYATVAYTGPAAGFDRNSVVDIRTSVSKVNWPQNNRNLMLNFDYTGNLLKDAGLVNVLNIGTDDPVRAAKLGQLFQFREIQESNYIPTNAENLMGYAVHPEAAIFATAPILPAPNERLQMGFYEVITDDQTDVSFEFKAFGNPQMSRDSYIIECNYGYGKANTAALQRIISA